MGTIKGFSDPIVRKNIFSFHYRFVLANTSSGLPYTLTVAMVNHKKMVHPPSAFMTMV